MHSIALSLCALAGGIGVAICPLVIGMVGVKVSSMYGYEILGESGTVLYRGKPVARDSRAQYLAVFGVMPWLMVATSLLGCLISLSGVVGLILSIP
jgi:hypothetical protein